MKSKGFYIDVLSHALMSSELLFGKFLFDEYFQPDTPAYSSPFDKMFFVHFGNVSDCEGLRALSLLSALYLSVALCDFPQAVLRTSAMFLRENISLLAFNCTHYEALYSHLSSQESVRLPLLSGVNKVVYVDVKREDVYDAFDFLTNGL